MARIAACDSSWPKTNHGAEHLGLIELTRFRFDHQHAVRRAGNHEVETAVLKLRAGVGLRT